MSQIFESTDASICYCVSRPTNDYCVSIGGTDGVRLLYSGAATGIGSDF